MPADGQPTDVPDEALDARPTGRAGTPPSRDPDDPGPGAAPEQDVNAAARTEPDPPEGLAGP